MDWLPEFIVARGHLTRFGEGMMWGVVFGAAGMFLILLVTWAVVMDSFIARFPLMVFDARKKR